MLEASIDEVVLVNRKDLIIACERRRRLDRPSRRIKSRVECTVTKSLDEQERRKGLVVGAHRFLVARDLGSASLNFEEPRRHDAVHCCDVGKHSASRRDLVLLANDRDDYRTLSAAGFRHDAPSATNEIPKERHDAA